MADMNIINVGTEFNIYRADSVKTFKKLPTQIYKICFQKFKGFYLDTYQGLDIKEKVYGVHQNKVNKVINSFNHFERSLGVILSGDKGIGKSLFSKMLAQECLKQDIPVIVVDAWYPAIADFIESIQQEVMILFDEFDKTFGEVNTPEGSATPQTELLSLFDGISTTTKRLYVITCNELRKLNDYLVNRPGRFHYHFRFEYPTSEEVKLYLEEKVDPKYHDQITDVIGFTKRTDINYDCLRAIAFELNMGSTFKEAIRDLNILNINDTSAYTIKVFFEDGSSVTRKKYRMNQDDEYESNCWFSPDKGENEFICCEFTPSDIAWDEKLFKYALMPDQFKYWCDEDYCKDDPELFKSYNNKKPIYMTFERDFKVDRMHYAL